MHLTLSRADRWALSNLVGRFVRSPHETSWQTLRHGRAAHCAPGCQTLAPLVCEAQERTSTNSVLVRAGKTACRSKRGPTRRRSTSSSCSSRCAQGLRPWPRLQARKFQSHGAWLTSQAGAGMAAAPSGCGTDAQLAAQWLIVLVPRWSHTVARYTGAGAASLASLALQRALQGHGAAGARALISRRSPLE